MCDRMLQIYSGSFYVICCLLLMVSCKENLPSEPLEAAFKVHARDNGNKGDATDIEVNYSQFGLDQIKNYRAFILKSHNEADHDLDFLLDLGESQYLDLAPNEVIPSRGVRLPVSMVDSDGDQITTGVAYKVAVISLPVNIGVYVPNIAYSVEDVILGINNVVNDFTGQLEISSGELAIDPQGNMMMASYDVISDLSNGEQTFAKILAISPSGVTTESDSFFQYLGGTDSDSEGNFYISNTTQAEILQYSPDGILEVVEHQGVELYEPTGIYVDPQGIIFVADRRSGFIYRLDQDGNSSEYAEVSEHILGLTGDNNGNLYASINNIQGKIAKITPDGRVSTLAQIPTYVRPDYILQYISWLGHLEFHNGMLYVAGTSTNRIYTVSLVGEVSVFAGTGERLLPHGDILSADFNRPFGLDFSPDGKTLYISGCEDTTPQHTQASYPSRVYYIDLVE